MIRWRTSTEISAPNTSTPAWRVASVVSSVPRRREPETKSALPSRIGRDHGADLVGLVLAVGVDRDDHLGAAGAGQPVAEPQRGALAAVDRHVADERARPAVAAAAVASLAPSTTTITSVCSPAASAGIVGDHLGDGRLLVVGGDDDRQRRAGAGRVLLQERLRRAALGGLEAGVLLAGLIVDRGHRVAGALTSAIDHSSHTPDSPSSSVGVPRRPAGGVGAGGVDDHRRHLAGLGRTVANSISAPDTRLHGVDHLEHRQRGAGADHRRPGPRVAEVAPRRIAATTSWACT